jgi:hypothetical protein
VNLAARVIRVFPIYWEHDYVPAKRMVTISDLSEDDDRLLELFVLLDRRDQGMLMRQASVTACFALAQRARIPQQDGTDLIDTPEAVTLRALRRCAPRLPCGWPSDTGFEDQVECAVRNRLDDRALDMILTTSEHDAGNAQLLAEWAGEFADRFGPDYCAPKFVDGYIDAATMKRFIEDWRDAFLADLRQSYARLSGALSHRSKLSQ